MTTSRLVLSASVLAFLLVQPVGGTTSMVRVGTVRDARSERLDRLYEDCRGEILELLGPEFRVEFDPDRQLVGDWTRSSATRALDALLEDESVDVVLAFGPVSSHDLVGRGALSKPGIATTVLDPTLAGLPPPTPGSGVRNLTYLTTSRPLADELALFAEAVPLARIAILSHHSFWNLLPGARRRLESDARAAEIESVDWVSVGDLAAPALAAIPERAQGVYLFPLPMLEPAERDALVEGLRARSLPSFAWDGDEVVRHGALMGIADAGDEPLRARRVALDLQRILLGETPESLAVEVPFRGGLVVDLDTARALGAMPPWQILIEAELIGDASDRGATLTLEAAVAEAVRADLDLVAAAAGVAAGAEEERIARARLWPDLQVAAAGSWIDPDRADSLLFPAQRTWTASLGASWSLFVEPLWAGWSIQRQVQQSREVEYEQRRLDVAQAAATAFLQVHRAQALERIRRDDLRLTRSNLHVSQTRVELGVASEAEIARWQSQLAVARRAAMDAWTARQQAEIALLRLLHRELDEEPALADVELSDPGLVVSDPRFFEIHRDPLRTRRFRDFAVAEGVGRAPEVERLDHLIVAKQREVVSARRAFWMPRVGLEGGLRDVVAEGGAGSDRGGVGLPGGVELTSPDRSWSIGLTVGLPLFTGGERAAARTRAENELLQLRSTRDAVAERVAARIRTAVLGATASYLGIRFSRDGARAATRNLELVSDAYARGVVSVVDLLDAQNSARAAQEAAENAEYEFLIDLMEVQRATNRFDFFVSREDRSRWLDRAERYVEEAR